MHPKLALENESSPTTPFKRASSAALSLVVAKVVYRNDFLIVQWTCRRSSIHAIMQISRVDAESLFGIRGVVKWLQLATRSAILVGRVEGRHSSPGTFTGRWKKFYRIHGTKNDRRWGESSLRTLKSIRSFPKRIRRWLSPRRPSTS